MAIMGYFIDENWNYRELLLGFEPLHRSHTGVNLSSVLLNLLQEHGIADRVLAITTDNASNNTTMMSKIQESIQCFELENNTAIIQVPCIAHVIQLSLNQLLGHMKANPKNETISVIWSEAQFQSACPSTRQPTQEIANTLKKVSVPSSGSIILLIIPTNHCLASKPGYIY
jgi:hypothetical protein